MLCCVCVEKSDDAGTLEGKLSDMKAPARCRSQNETLTSAHFFRLWSAVKPFHVQCVKLSTLRVRAQRYKKNKEK